MKSGSGKKPYELLDEIAAARACLTKGGVNDLTKAARLLLDEFRGGKLGRITLEIRKRKKKRNNIKLLKMQRCADISRKYSDDDCFDEMKGEKLRMQAEKLCEDKELGRIWQDGC